MGLARPATPSEDIVLSSFSAEMLKEEDADDINDDKETCCADEETRKFQFSRFHSDPEIPEGTVGTDRLRTPSLPRLPKDDEGSHFHRQVTAPAVMQVADYFLRPEMTVLYEGSRTLLANSKVRRSSAYRETSEDANGYSPKSTKSVEVDVAVKSVALNEDDCDLAMMRRECEILNRLGHSHPHIMPALGFAEFASEMVLLMRFASEGDLSRLAPSGSCFEEIQAQRLGKQVMSALAFLEEHRIIHGDVKPQNVLLTLAEGRLLAQLTDFGLAQELPPGQPYLKMDEVPGSYGYIASEVKHRRHISFAADLFALGVILFRLLGSYDPFHPASDVDSELIFDEECWDPLSPLSQDTVTRLLSPNPATRGFATKLLKGDPWFNADESQLVGKARTGFAPTPVQNVDFHTLEDSATVWKVLQPVR
ncbi:Calcium/calmodulin-dependent protein kinase type I (CaMK-I) [Durusdinium trenchii]|uniref:Calcium/calmodulin-dependent protein kinase type I (CaMK-I) n=1 Tax=Durusdinium trenchii TaxID=1381693 RepID=A0ABP0IQS8_9DINO